ncbi:MAG: class F sortase, partial [Candidatus Colwellbacteria bacterium]|nr:class F sortase [Candidatus Colwellbacteria bacterium]
DDTSLQSLETSDDILTPTKVGYTLPESAPIRLRIPAINVDAPFIGLGLKSNGEIEIPAGYEEVGWYTKGPTPGEIGPAVVLGHVDSYQGPAVFFSLGQLKPGDSIEIERQDGKTAVFHVDYLERYPQSEFPTALVYGDLDYAGLRLITCSGIYDRETNEYNLNLVVYASLTDVEEPSGRGISID